MNHGRNNSIWPVLLMLAGGWGCGTVVGNPKQPKPDDSPRNAIVYEIPSISFDVGDVVDDESSSLQLTGASLVEDPAGGDRSLLQHWGKRVDRIIASINALSAKVTKFAEDERSTSDEDVIKFSGRGSEGQWSGRLAPLAEGGDYAYEAVLCFNGKPFSQIQWSEDGDKVELTRDFSVKADADDDAFGLRSRITAVLGTTISLDVQNEGEWTDEVGAAAGYFAERTRSTSTLEEIELKAVAHRGPARPETFTGSSYLVGRLVAAGSKDNPRKKNAAFVGYDDRFAASLCRHGFDEEAADLWAPDLVGPRFCLGRPLGAKRFQTRAEFLATLTDLSAIGILPQAELSPVELDPGLTCE